MAPRKAKKRWYHVSPADLPEGTALTPGKGKGHHALGPDSRYVYVTDSPENAEFWRKRLKAPNLYEVVPEGDPTTSDTWTMPGNPLNEWRVPRATVVGRAEEPPDTIDEILDLIGGNTFNDPKPKPAGPQEKRPTYREHLLATEDSTSKAHVIMPTELVDRYREYQREPGGKDYRSEYEDVLAVIEEQGIRQPLWISTDGKTAMLVEGNNRLAVAKELGIEDLPVRITYDKETRRNEGVDPAPLDPDLKSWVEENRIREDYRGKTPYGSDAFPDRETGDRPEPIGDSRRRLLKPEGGKLESPSAATKTKPSRKSRSYLNPEHREDVLAKAGAVSVPYRNAVKDIQHRVTEYVRAAYKSNPQFLTNHEDIDRLTALMAPALAAGQMQIADLTNAHLANLFGLENPPSVDVSKYGRPGVSRETELSRPFWTAVKAAREGKSTDEALAAGMRRMEKMLATDFQMAKVIQSRDALKAGGVQQYSRVAGPKACWLCAIAATQIYYTEDLLPIHPGCGCDVAPVPPGGQKTLDDVLDKEFLLSESADQVKLMAEKVESDASPAELRDLVAVREHGETGPTLTWAHQNFTGPNDLPVPVSRDVLAQEAYETVRKNGGITIDLAGHQPPEGYAYAPYKTTEFKVSEAEFTPKHIDDYVDSHFEELSQEGNHLGMWVQNGYVYLDVSKVGPPEASTFAKAQAADQLAVFDLKNFEEINLGTIDDTGKYRSLGEATDLHNQYREQVGRGDESRSAAGVSDVPVGAGAGGRLESGSPTKGLEWDGPPVAKPIIPDTTNVNEPDWDNDPALVHSDIDSIWGTDQFDEYKNDFRRGARTAQLEGYSGFDPELYDYIESHPGQYGDARADETVAEYGKEIVSGAVHSEPTEDLLYRGIRVEAPPDFKIGDTVSMPLSSFSLDASEAADHAAGQRGWQSVDVPEDGGGIVFELEPGAKTYHHLSNGEHVAFGQFEVLKVTQYEPGGTAYVSVRQTSMIESEETYGYDNARKAKGDTDIPEFTIVKGKPADDDDIEILGGTKLRLKEVDPEAKPGIRRAIEDFHTKHPDVVITSVDISWDLPEGTYAVAKPFSGVADHGWDTAISLNGKHFGVTPDGEDTSDGTRYQRTTKRIRKESEDGWSVPIPDDMPVVEAVMKHELGHGFDAAGFEETRNQIHDVLGAEFKRLHPELDPGISGRKYAEARKSGGDAWIDGPDGSRMQLTFDEWLAEHPEEIQRRSRYSIQYRDWLHDNMSDYSFEGGRKGPTSSLKKGEALAEAYADVDMNGDKASATSKLLVARMSENAAPVQRIPVNLPSGGDAAAKVDAAEKVRLPKALKTWERLNKKIVTGTAKEARAREAEAKRVKRETEKRLRAEARQRRKDVTNLRDYGTTDPEEVARLKAIEEAEKPARAAIEAKRAEQEAFEKSLGFGSVTSRITEGVEIKPILKDGKPDKAATFAWLSSKEGREVLKENWRLAMKHTEMWALQAGKVWYPELNRLTKRLQGIYAEAFQDNWGIPLTNDLVASFIGSWSENNLWAGNLVGVRKFLDGTGSKPEFKNSIGRHISEILAGPERFTSLDQYDYSRRKVTGIELNTKTGKFEKKTNLNRWLSGASTEFQVLGDCSVLPGATAPGKAYDFHVNKALRAIQNPEGGVIDFRQHADTAPKPADFAANADGDYSRGTADRWVARIMLHTEDEKFAEALRTTKKTKGGEVDPVGYKLFSSILQELADEYPGLDVAALQAGPWIEVVGPLGSVAYVENLESLDTVNQETLLRVKEFGEIK